MKLSSLAALALLTLTLPAFAEPEQLLKNSSFKDGDMAWNLKGGIQVTNELGPDGASIVLLTGDPTKTTITSASFPVTPKTAYNFAVWARSVADGQGGATIKFLDKAGKPIPDKDQQTGVGSGEDDWQNVEIAFTAPDGAASAILILNGGSTGQGRFEFSNPKVYTDTPTM